MFSKFLCDIQAKPDEESPVLLSGLPVELVSHIINFLGDERLSGTSRLAQTCRFFNEIYMKLLNLGLVREALQAILQGNYEYATYIAEISPQSFFISVENDNNELKDYSIDLNGNYREIKGWSAYQAIFGTGHIEMLEDRDGEPTLLKISLDVFLNSIPDGHDQALQYLRDKFPNGFEYPKSEFNFEPLINAIIADSKLNSEVSISNDIWKIIDFDHPEQPTNLDVTTLELWNEFKNYFKPGVIHQGYHFNINHFIKAASTIQQFEEKVQLNSNQRYFCQVKIIGFLQRLFTAFHIEQACRGINYACTNIWKHKRLQFQQYELDIWLTPGSDLDSNYDKNIFPLNQNPERLRLGIDFVIATGYDSIAVGDYYGKANFNLDHWINYIKKTENCFKKLYPNLNEQKSINHKTSSNAKLQLNPKMLPFYINSSLDRGYHRLVESLIKHFGYDNTAVNGNSLAILAADKGHYKVIEILVKYKRNGVAIDLDEVSTNNNVTPVLIAAQNGHHEIVKILAQSNVDLNRPTAQGATPTFMAAYHGYDKVITILAEYKVDLNKAENQGITPIYIAAQQGHKAVVDQLLSLGANPHLTYKATSADLKQFADKNPETKANIVTFIKLLIPDFGDEYYLTPFDIAAIKGHQAILNGFFEHAIRKNDISLLEYILNSPWFNNKMLYLTDSLNQPILSNAQVEAASILKQWIEKEYRKENNSSLQNTHAFFPNNAITVLDILQTCVLKKKNLS